jgi:hypothetical protein
MRVGILGGLALGALALSAAHAGGLPAMTESDMCRIIRGDIVRYLATGHPCACPYNVTRTGKLCDRLSAWSKPGGAAPRCYLEDVTDEREPDVRGGPVRKTPGPPPPCQPIS